jgi:hypothetical protein
MTWILFHFPGPFHCCLGEYFFGRAIFIIFHCCLGRYFIDCLGRCFRYFIAAWGDISLIA